MFETCKKNSWFLNFQFIIFQIKVLIYMEDNKNDISVAISTYNGGKFLNEQLISLVNQTHKLKEIIIIDDFSTDSTVQIIEKFIIAFPFIQLFINNENKGPVKTFEIALSKYVSNYNALSDQVYILDSNKLEEIIHN